MIIKLSKININNRVIIAMKNSYYYWDTFFSDES